jgi:hypothetical protein
MLQRERGRPATGKGVQIQVRLQPTMLKAVDGWMHRYSPQHSRPEAIRQLISLGLKSPIPKPKTESD